MVSVQEKGTTHNADKNWCFHANAMEVAMRAVKGRQNITGRAEDVLTKKINEHALETPRRM